MELHVTLFCIFQVSYYCIIVSVHSISQASMLEWGCYFLLQGIFLTQGLNPHLLYLLHWQMGSSPPHHQGSPTVCEGFTTNVCITSIFQGKHCVWDILSTESFELVVRYLQIQTSSDHAKY